MEDKKKTLRELEAKKAETQELLARLFESLGGSLIAHLESGGKTFPDLPQSAAEGENPGLVWQEKLRLDKEIADTEGKIKAVETDLARLGDLEGEINRKESENTEKTKEMAAVNTELGRLILEDSGFDDFSASYRQQLEDLFHQIDSQEKKLGELENADSNFITRLTSGAKGWLTKSQLAKNEATLKGLYKSAGEKFIQSRTQGTSSSGSSAEISDESNWADEISNQVHKAEELVQLQSSLKNDVSRLLIERREIANTLNQDGNPVRRISGFEKYIVRIKDEMRVVNRRFGSCVNGNEWKANFLSLYTEDDRVLEEKISSLEESLKDTENRIEMTKTAITIDYENAEIEKMKHTIQDKQNRISEAQAVITETEEQITAAEKRIEELSSQKSTEKTCPS